MEDFRKVLPERCKQIVAAATRVNASEEATKQALILPFLAALGYDVFNPAEVTPEHHCDFGEKYKNRVDYAIMRDDAPVIAIEAKAAGAKLEDDRGQLRSYFNAARTVKLGVLTDGLIYECFADTDEPNMMDAAPFLRFDLRQIAEGKADERTLHGVESLRRDAFDPANVGAEARRRLLLSEFLATLKGWRESPSDDLVKLLVKEAGVQGNVTKRVIDESRDLVRQALGVFIDQAILERVGFADRPVVKIEQPAPPPAAPAKDVEVDLGEANGVVTTETELRIYNHILRRLAFLVDDESLYHELDHVQYQDFRTTFTIYYKRPRAGMILNFKEFADGSYQFAFPALDRTITTRDLTEIDAPLLEAFMMRVKVMEPA